MKLIIFDCDGVLVDSEGLACEVTAECLSEMGFPTSKADVMERYLGSSLSYELQDIERRHGRPVPEDFPALLQDRLWKSFAENLKAVEGISTLLEAHDAARCVASSSTPERLHYSLKLTKLIDYFEPHVFSATMVRNGKPAPDLFLLAAEKMQSAPEGCIVVEDSETGIRAARAAGMQAIAFLGGSHRSAHNASALKKAGAHKVAHDSSELIRLLA